MSISWYMQILIFMGDVKMQYKIPSKIQYKIIGNRKVLPNRFKKKVFIPFLILGDPDYNTSLEIIKSVIDHGVDALELGFAFSDPIMDGITIQKANNRALSFGMNIKKAFDLLNDIRKYSDVPISLMLSFNLIYNYGIDNFLSECNKLNINAVLCPDIPLEESNELVNLAIKHDVNIPFIISLTTSYERIKKICDISSGYIYLVSLLGITGKRENINYSFLEQIKLIRGLTELPIYVGFGISKSEHVKHILTNGADGVIVGSAIINLIDKNLENNQKMISEIIN